MPRRTLDHTYREEIRLAYFGASCTDERKRIIERACKESGYSYGGLMRVLDLKVRSRALSSNEHNRVASLNEIARMVWDYQQEHSSNTRKISTAAAIEDLKEKSIVHETIGYFQISEAIRRQRLKNKAQSHFHRFQRSTPLSMVQMDFTRSAYFEHLKKGDVSFVRIVKPKGANAKHERVWIAVAIDDASRVVYARYYLVKGESSRLAQHFLLSACAPKSTVDTSTGEVIPTKLLQGMPKRLYTDRGSAFRNSTFPNGLRKLGIIHTIGSTSVDTQGKRQTSSNKQARGKVERMHLTIKDGFEARLFLKYKEGTTFTLKELNRKFQKWLMRYNSATHPERSDSTRWELFAPALESAIYPHEEAALLFSSSVYRKVQRRQVRVADGIYCKVPPEIATGSQIEIVTAAGNYYTMLGGRRVLLETVSAKAASATLKAPERQEFDSDCLVELQLRSRLNREIETRTRQQYNIGTLTEQFGVDFREFLSERRSISELKKFVTGVLVKAERGLEFTVAPDGELVNVRESRG